MIGVDINLLPKTSTLAPVQTHRVPGSQALQLQVLQGLYDAAVRCL